jgi:hypothetical protein
MSTQKVVLNQGSGIIRNRGLFRFRDVRRNSWLWCPILRVWGHLKVFINPQILRTATFLVDLDDDKPYGTVFFVHWFLEGSGIAHYAVTAAHNVERGPTVGIRFNVFGTNDSETQYSKADEWAKHASTDIAVLPIPQDISLEKYGIGYIDVDKFADTQEHLVEPQQGVVFWEGSTPPIEAGLRYGTGDEVFSVGLFEGHTGDKLAQPVARFGHIALRPAEGEKVFAEIKSGELTPVDAFLVEMAVWPGQSGSPVFLHHAERPESRAFTDRSTHTDYLIGMVQGQYPGEQEIKVDGRLATMSQLQMGIAIVLPVKDILEVLMDPRLQEHRERLKRERQQNPKIRPKQA